jgi:hypothetical protein
MDQLKLIVLGLALVLNSANVVVLLRVAFRQRRRLRRIELALAANCVAMALAEVVQVNVYATRLRGGPPMVAPWDGFVICVAFLVAAVVQTWVLVWIVREAI